MNRFLMRDDGTTPVSSWPHYEALEMGLKNYWYPILCSRSLRRNPVSLRLFGERVVLIRDQGRAYALADRCAHRGTPLSLGRRDFPGTISCSYHGWCYSLATGQVVAALTDGPDSPMVGKVSIRAYPVEERIGFVWIYMGEGEPPPVEEDIPEELLDPRMVICARITDQEGNWRYAVENHFDDAHANSLHRSALYSVFWRQPAWRTGIRVVRNGKWLEREFEGQYFEGEYPGLGRWPRHSTPKRRAPVTVSVQLPGTGRVAYRQFTAYKFFTPIDKGHFRFTQLVTKRATGLGPVIFRLQYWLYRRWLYHVLFNNQDMLMTKVSHTQGPERLFRPDVSITAWRKACEEARREQMAVGLPKREGWPGRA
ncbi:MAG: Rieske 2Fe-2S domain-containing protein [Deltaproteobacteria bacterium]|nr:Rieske 2Fe-2S domain-containing protein [Deltaproteobacteria bacterium]